ncbi:MAG: hypothetical protein KF774_17495 [Planctomyces sp.]|nr:hypothetical protein [Planctomyces sp.]
MIRKSLALLIRALRVDARSIRPHLMRFGLVLIVLYLLWFSSSVSSFFGAPGLALFRSIAWANIVFITLVGVTYFSSAVTEEKEERTLGLLKMADVGGAAILLGKWAPRMVGMLSLLIVQIPFTLLSITLGGVTLEQVLATYAGLLAYLAWVGAVSLLSSVVMRTTGAACVMAFMLLLARAYGPLLMPLFELIGGGSRTVELGEGNQVVDFLWSASVSALVEGALSPMFAGPRVPMHLLWMLGESAAALFLAWVLFEPCTSAESVESAQPTWRKLVPSLGKPRSRRAWTMALVGKDFRQITGGQAGGMLRLAVYSLIAFVSVLLASSTGALLDRRDAGGFFVWWGIVFLILDAVLASARVFRAEVHDLTWSSLMMLPRGLADVAFSKIVGCLLGLWPGIAMIAAGLLLAPDFLGAAIRDIFFNADTVMGWLYGLLQVLLVLELTMLFSIAMRWAAWPLAVPLAAGVVIAANVLIWTCLAMILFPMPGASAQFVLWLLCVVDAAVVLAIGVMIAGRLQRLAAEGT